MFRIIGCRSNGKTNSLLLLAKEKNATIICRDPRKILQKAYFYGITGIKLLSYEDVMNEVIETDVLIDDLEDFAQFFTNHHTIGFTLSDE